jgi:hypothetical protein
MNSATGSFPGSGIVLMHLLSLLFIFAAVDHQTIENPHGLRTSPHFAQTGVGIHRGFNGQCGRGGNLETQFKSVGEFSNSPDFHLPVLEMWTGYQTALFQKDGKSFHFSYENCYCY